MDEQKTTKEIINHYNRLLGIRHRLKYPAKNPRIKLKKEIRRYAFQEVEKDIKKYLKIKWKKRE